MFTDYIPYDSHDRITQAIFITKEVFGESDPYTTETRLDGDVIIFDDHFITVFREALTTGCMAKMNAGETALFWEFIEYQNGASERDITRGSNSVMDSLDQWLTDEIACVPHPVLNSCFDAPTHTWTSGCI